MRKEENKLFKPIYLTHLLSATYRAFQSFFMFLVLIIICPVFFFSLQTLYHAFLFLFLFFWHSYLMCLKKKKKMQTEA